MSKKVIFKTNINCASCKATVEKVFEGKELYDTFDVDYSNPEKPATFTLREGVEQAQVEKLIKEAGYKAEVVRNTSFLDRLRGKR